jgi:GABA permease
MTRVRASAVRLRGTPLRARRQVPPLMEAPSGLRRTLQRRHMQMIALGGVIGAGLFVGSGVVVSAAGPAAVISFAITGSWWCS